MINVVSRGFRAERPTFGLVVLEEQLDNIDVLRAGEGVTSNTDTERLTQPDVSCLGHGLIGQGP